MALMDPFVSPSASAQLRNLAAKLSVSFPLLLRFMNTSYRLLPGSAALRCSTARTSRSAVSVRRRFAKMSRKTSAPSGTGASVAGFVAGAVLAVGSYLFVTHYDEISDRVKRLVHNGHGHDSSSIPDRWASFQDAQQWADKFESSERLAYMQPDSVISDVIEPLLNAALGTESDTSDVRDSLSRARDLCLADIGAGTGLMAMRLCRAFPTATIIATDSSAGMQGFLARRLADAAATESGSTAQCFGRARVLCGGSTRAGLPQPADLLLMCTSYHHLDEGELEGQGHGHSHSHSHSHGHGHSHGHSHSHGEAPPPGGTSGQGRVRWLKESVARGDVKPGGFAVVIEYKEGDMPIQAPPPQFRLSRGKIVEEFSSAGWSLVAAPDLLQYHHVLVFSAPR